MNIRKREGFLKRLITINVGGLAIGRWIFAWTATGAIVITLLTVSVQTIMAASANPVRCLRSE